MGTSIRRHPWLLAPAAVVVVALLAIGWYLGSPLFITTRVEESFPASAAPTAASAATATAQPMAESNPAGQPATPPPAPAPPRALLSGSFKDADSFHKGSGRAVVYQLADGKRVLRLEDFQTTNGPDLYVVLAGVPEPKSSAEVHGPGYVEIARLKGNVGNQNYDLPDSVDLGSVRSVVIYCKRFAVVFSTAALGPAT